MGIIHGGKGRSIPDPNLQKNQDAKRIRLGRQQITMNRNPRPVLSHRIPLIVSQHTNDDYDRWVNAAVQASALIKLIDGVANNAAWAACLDAYEYLKPLKRFNQQVRGGNTAGYAYKRCFNAFKEYQRGLIYTSENRFFHVADMTEETRDLYAKDMTDEEYYDFWASFGFKAYQDNKQFLTCLVNKLRLVYEKNGIRNAEAAAWSMGAYMSLSVATECHKAAVEAVAKQWGGAQAEWQRFFKSFDLSSVEKLWGSAHKDFFPELAKVEFSDDEFGNIKLSFNQWADRLVKGKTLVKSRLDTVADFADDIFRTPGCAKKAMRELSSSELASIE